MSSTIRARLLNEKSSRRTSLMTAHWMSTSLAKIPNIPVKTFIYVCIYIIAWGEQATVYGGGRWGLQTSSCRWKVNFAAGLALVNRNKSSQNSTSLWWENVCVEWWTKHHIFVACYNLNTLQALAEEQEGNWWLHCWGLGGELPIYIKTSDSKKMLSTNLLSPSIPRGGG